MRDPGNEVAIPSTSAGISVFLVWLLDQGRTSERNAQHLRRQEKGFHVCDFPSSFLCILFQLSHLKTHLLGLLKIF